MSSAAGSVESFVQFVTVLFLFVFVLALSYFVTRWLSNIQKGQMVGKNMEVLETLRISNSKYLQIVRVGDKHLVIAVCKDTVTMLTEVSGECLSYTDRDEGNNLSFKEILEKFKKGQST